MKPPLLLLFALLPFLSITAGAAASSPDCRYANLVAAHLQSLFPHSPITLVNAGVGATGSPFASLRAQRDLLARHPDLAFTPASCWSAYSRVRKDGPCPLYHPSRVPTPAPLRSSRSSS